MVLYSEIGGHVLTPFFAHVKMIEVDQSARGKLLYTLIADESQLVKMVADSW